MKTRTVYIAIDVPVYGVRNALKCTDSILDSIEKSTPPVNETARAPRYVVKSVRVA